MAEKRKTNGHSRPEDFLLPDVPEIEELTLPSGLPVKLRSPMHEEFWIRAGELPAFLLPPKKGEKKPPIDPAEAVRWSQQVVAALIAEPVFSLQPEEGEYHPRRLPLEDRLFLSRYYARHMGMAAEGGGGAGLKSFRGEGGEPGGAGQDGEEVRQGSE